MNELFFALSLLTSFIHLSPRNVEVNVRMEFFFNTLVNAAGYFKDQCFFLGYDVC